MARRSGLPPDRLADLLVEAASRFSPDADPQEVSDAAEELIEAATKEEDNDMTDDFVKFAKRVAAEGDTHLSEAEATEMILKYASINRLGNESQAAAFNRIFTADDDVGVSLRKMVQVCKGIPHPHI